MEAKEGIILDAEGKTLHDPNRQGSPHVKAKIQGLKTMGLLPKIFLGGALAVFLMMGLTIAGFVLITFLVGLIFKRSTRSRIHGVSRGFRL